ncbi:MAG: hypothetical protein CVU24_16740 [Betaproteobacteria bacterium HGW-Betaproteobacteria-18]|jgi:hypothetical protein|nr:MAG: hypothetical protein CVU73_14690 [Deltaproteobacteria bacterium HGW-Deltaproteobacteria-8]PKO58706.1 MAG: hypothetical protein CVU24_16740 [Betaproteobacteria bacterium HGW-Betaproteobacteria-18]
MVDFGNDRVCSVGLTLLEIAWMDMDVCDNGVPRISAVRPKVSESAPINLDVSRSERVGVNIVVENKLLNAANTPLGS